MSRMKSTKQNGCIKNNPNLTNMENFSNKKFELKQDADFIDKKMKIESENQNENRIMQPLAGKRNKSINEKRF